MYRDARLLVMNERRMDALEEKCNGTVFLPSHIAGSSSAIVGGCQSSMVRVEHAACPHIRCRYSGFTYVSRYVARARGTATCYPLTDCSEQKRGGLVLHLVRALNRNEQRLFLRVFFFVVGVYLTTAVTTCAVCHGRRCGAQCWQPLYAVCLGVRWSLCDRGYQL
jgi:hypothetical protein